MHGLFSCSLGHSNEQHVNPSSDIHLFVTALHRQEKLAGVKAVNLSCVEIQDKTMPIILFLHDGATTPREMAELKRSISSKLPQWNSCFLCLPGHGGNTNNLSALNNFTPTTALTKVSDAYKLLSDHFSAVHIVGISTGALLAMLLSADITLARAPESLTLIAPYVAPFMLSELMLANSHLLNGLNKASCCGVVEGVISAFSGHQVDLSAQTFLFKKPRNMPGFQTVPLDLVKQESLLVAQLGQQVGPMHARVHTIINEADPYTNPALAERTVNAFFADPSCSVSVEKVLFAEKHCIADNVACAPDLVNRIVSGLLGMPHNRCDLVK